MRRVNRIHNSDWRDGFLFLGNELALDFLNTRPVQNGEPMELLPDISALLRWFHAAELLSARDAANLQQKWGKSARALRTVEAVRELRERLRKEVLALGTWRRSASDDHRPTKSPDGGPSDVYQAEGERKRILDGAVVRTAPTRRLVCPAGAQRGHVVRQCGSQSRPQV